MRHTFARRTRAASNNACASFNRITNLLLDLVALGCGVQRSNHDALFHAIPHAKFLNLRNQLRHEFVVDCIEEIQAFDRETGLPTIEEAAD